MASIKPFSRLPAPQHVQAGSTFLNRLPPELRNKIYTLAFQDTTIKIGTKGKVEDPPALPFTCKQIHAEAIQVFYAEAMFYAKDAEGLHYYLNKLAGHDRRQRQNLMTRIRLEPLYDRFERNKGLDSMMFLHNVRPAQIQVRFQASPWYIRWTSSPSKDWSDYTHYGSAQEEMQEGHEAISSRKAETLVMGKKAAERSPWVIEAYELEVANREKREAMIRRRRLLARQLEELQGEEE